MNAAVRVLSVAAALAGLGGTAWYCQSAVSRRETAGHGVAAPSPAAEMVVAGLGGFRGIAAEAVWFRMDRLQDEGRYAELAQLASWLTFLEPRTSGVWAYSAWNLAYNVSVMMPSPADRWRWVLAGIRLLRDDGLRLSPDDPVLYRELAWLFLLKLSGGLDSAQTFYRQEWGKIVRTVQQNGDWPILKMDGTRCAEIDAEYGRQDWTDPLASALYWAHAGLAFTTADQPVRHELRRILVQALLLESHQDARFAPRALKELLTADREEPRPDLKRLIESHRAHFHL